ncbi:MAG: NAD kinase [Bacteroidales bacterium]|nr:NAD kinase [Bacteroidales bacterium]
MNLALFGRTVTDPMLPYLQGFVQRLEETSGSILIYKPFFDRLNGRINFTKQPNLFMQEADLNGKVDFLCTIGGDGTILDAVALTVNSGIPIIGVNMGRLGFLSSISKDEIIPAMEDILANNYSLEERTLLHLHGKEDLFGGFPYAMNELTIHKSDMQTMLMIQVSINDEFLNSYWADGLIVSTPTGSTAYSLSCAGPIIAPGSENLVITPIASHNLTVRPIVIRDDSTIRIVVEGYGDEFFVAMDSRKEKVKSGMELIVTKAGFSVKLVRLPGRHFFKTIREKLNWGLDARN